MYKVGCCSFKADIRMLQETKLSSMSDSTVKEIWGASTGDNWICCESIGALRGILVMCNRVIFTKKYEWIEAFSLHSARRGKVLIALGL